MKRFMWLVLGLIAMLNSFAQLPPNYKNFTVSVYTRAYEVQEMSDPKKLEETWDLISKQVKIDKIYLETHRDKIVVDEKTLEMAIKFFQSKGLKVAGGITYTMDEGNNFETFCFSNPEHRKKAREIAELTARHFDEFILDDFFFTSCKCDLCIQAKGDQSWTNYRLKLMTEAAEELIIKPAKAVNPKVKVVIKYPNWYEHFQGLGFNLETEPKMFDGIYTGTETRDPVFSDQHLQQYESYLIIRYFNNIAPGRNGGGWVDPFGAAYADRYAEQFWLTLFAKAPEITMFDYRSLQTPVTSNLRGPWQGNQTSFDFDNTIKTIALKNGKTSPATVARIAGNAFEQVDPFIGMLGIPVGVKSYKPYHSIGEDFLQNYLGMIGIPMDIVPEFPADDPMIILTETAAADPDIISKIKKRLHSGKSVIITSGFLRVMQEKGLNDIVELRYTDRKALVTDFRAGWLMNAKSEKPILIPQINYLTNDSWEEISATNGATGWPILHRAQYSNAYLYVLTIPDNFSDLYQYPSEVLNKIRALAMQNMDIKLEGPSQVSLFNYDNGTFILESFHNEPVTVKIIAKESIQSLLELTNNSVLNGTQETHKYRRNKPAVKESVFEITLKPHSYRVFQLK
jgi:hypothetical protein